MERWERLSPQGFWRHEPGVQVYVDSGESSSIGY
jgi:hypothetical protein